MAKKKDVPFEEAPNPTLELPAEFDNGLTEDQRQAVIAVKIEDIRDQEALERAMGNTGRAQQHKERRELLIEAAKLEPVAAWGKALEKIAEFRSASEDTPFEKERALWDAHLYAYAAWGRGCDTMELLQALEQRENPVWEVVTDGDSE
ncbi:MAG: hypothetical protein RLZZ156_498 [Deinococcota bacterium]|jgi:hypothetical protein